MARRFCNGCPVGLSLGVSWVTLASGEEQVQLYRKAQGLMLILR